MATLILALFLYNKNCALFLRMINDIALCWTTVDNFAAKVKSKPEITFDFTSRPPRLTLHLEFDSVAEGTYFPTDPIYLTE